MKRTVTFILIVGLAAASATAEARWFGKLPGGGSLFSKASMKPMMPAVSLPQEPCFRFAYTAENRDSTQDLFSAGNCLSETKGLVHSPSHVSHLGAGRMSPDLAFLQEGMMNLMNLMSGAWNIFEAGVGFPERFSPKAMAWDASGRLAVISREMDGGFALRVNEGPAYYVGDTALVQSLGMVPPQDMEWVPEPGQARSRFLIVSFGNIPEAIDLYVFDMEATEIRPIPLEEGSMEDTRVRAMRGAQPAFRNSGEDMLFVRHSRIMGCQLDFSHMEDATPRAFCTDAREPQRLRMIEDAEMASPAVSQDGEWLFFAMKTPTSSWDIYRSSLTRLFLTPLTTTASVDEKEVVSVPDWIEITARTTQTRASTIREEPQYHVVPYIRATAQTVEP